MPSGLRGCLTRQSTKAGVTAILLFGALLGVSRSVSATLFPTCQIPGEESVSQAAEPEQLDVSVFDSEPEGTGAQAQRPPPSWSDKA